MTTTPTPRRGRPTGLGQRERMDEAHFDTHDSADAMARLDDTLAAEGVPLRAPSRVMVREAWVSLMQAARKLDTHTHLPRIAS